MLRDELTVDSFAQATLLLFSPSVNDSLEAVAIQISLYSIELISNIFRIRFYELTSITRHFLGAELGSRVILKQCAYGQMPV